MDFSSHARSRDPEKHHRRAGAAAARARRGRIEPVADQALNIQPVVDWLDDGAPARAPPQEVLLETCRRMVAAGLPLYRVGVFVRTLHPNVLGRGVHLAGRPRRGRDRRSRPRHARIRGLPEEPDPRGVHRARRDPPAPRRPGLPDGFSDPRGPAQGRRDRLPRGAAALPQRRGARGDLRHAPRRAAFATPSSPRCAGCCRRLRAWPRSTATCARRATSSTPTSARAPARRCSPGRSSAATARTSTR